ncbi:helix-turn-helix transcriptional regulator [Labrenzia sp. R4_1]|uniref:helix-turn-helix domain-containing protein n=1 Tax=Labrenzia sp. R4_1 TaxID=2821106 RepID=UPI001ADA6C43|nr:helix-turn-helix transcriptional regulator [Labrenzia sp. R4_1]MBO9424659.1 helix-turn-helix transcriptional regulator [Labrenzia sp. R4_1]
MLMQAQISSTGFPERVKMESMDTTGDRIIHIRKRLGLSQAEFADRISITRGAVGNWERNKGISKKNLERIASTFGCSLDWLLSGKGQPFPEGSQYDAEEELILGQKLDRTLFQVAHDMARRFEQTQLKGLASFDDFTFLVEKYYDELLARKAQFENGSKEDH